MKLIPEELIEKTASEFSYYAMEQYGFKEGARFAEEQLAPLFVEFAEWCPRTYDHLALNLWQEKRPLYIATDIKSKTTQQLFEEFINIKKQ